MKIAVFVDAFPVWTETFILKQITGLIDRGNDVVIYATSRRKLKQTHADINKYSLIERTHYFSDLPRNRFLHAFKAFSLIMGNFRWLNYRTWLLAIRIFKNRRRVGSWSTLILLYIAMPLIGQKPYDILHCQFGTLGPQVLLLRQIGALSGKLVTSFRGHDATQHANINSGIYDELFKQGDIFLPVSKDIKQRLIEMGCTEDKIKVLHSGIDCTKLEFRQRKYNKDEPVRIISIARFVEMKGLCYAIEAVSRLVNSNLDITYTVIGDGVLRDELERLIDKLGITRQVKLLGWMQHEEVNHHLQDAHILIAPSVTASNGETEGIPNAVKEAMAMGLPVVSTFHGGIPELVEDGISGFLVPERNVEALTERLIYLINHPDIWSDMGRAGREHIEKEFDIKALNDQLVEIFSS